MASRLVCAACQRAKWTYSSYVQHIKTEEIHSWPCCDSDLYVQFDGTIPKWCTRKLEQAVAIVNINEEKEIIHAE